MSAGCPAFGLDNDDRVDSGWRVDVSRVLPYLQRGCRYRIPRGFELGTCITWPIMRRIAYLLLRGESAKVLEHTSMPYLLRVRVHGKSENASLDN